MKRIDLAHLPRCTLEQVTDGERLLEICKPCGSHTDQPILDLRKMLSVLGCLNSSIIAFGPCLCRSSEGPVLTYQRPRRRLIIYGIL
jgi:hypothetical protein